TAKLVAFNNCDCHACGRKALGQRRTRLARPDDDCVEVPGHYLSFRVQGWAALLPSPECASWPRRDVSFGAIAIYWGSSPPVCSAAMYLAYQSAQFGSAAPIRFSCSPCAIDARRIAVAKSFAEP